MTNMTNLTQHPQSITLTEREVKNGHKAAVLWFTGLSGSGKSTLAMALQEKLFRLGCQVTVLDGDNVRQGLNAGLGFSAEDRIENLRRVAEVSRLFAESGFIVLTSFISPFQQERDRAKSIVAPHHFYEIYIQVDFDIAEQRDPKGLYKKARAGELKEFTGLDSPYEVPKQPDLVISNSTQSIKSGVDQLLEFLKDKAII
ncbi:MAG: adenylyl-sulfate kinase [Candidatus Marinimicrobia bacterium]|nr:adenylyl-sulfate kinase [Candidatus Neomarinimicrobiota bacterium]